MRAQLEAVIEELRAWQQVDQQTVYLADGWLERLYDAVRSQLITASPKKRAILTGKDKNASQGKALPQGATAKDTVSEEALRRPAANDASKGRYRVSKVMPQEDNFAKIAPIPPPTDLALPEGNKQTQWSWLRDRILHCPVCQEHIKPDKKVVVGVGDLDADIFFCGEAPGADEEILGEPFVGKAGELLTKIIGAMGLSREAVYIGNIMNWRPEMPTPYGNRPPTQEEMAFCLPYLKAQLAIVQPKVVVALGATAVNGLLGPDPQRRMGKLRGTWSSFAGTPLMVTYHPSYLLRNGTRHAKRQVWEDMLQVMKRVALPISDKQRRFFT